MTQHDPTHEHAQETGDQNQHMFTRWQCSTTLKDMLPNYQHCLWKTTKTPTQLGLDCSISIHFHLPGSGQPGQFSEIFPTFFTTEISSRNSPRTRRGICGGACGGVRRLRQLRGGAQPLLAPRLLGGRQARRQVLGFGGFGLAPGTREPGGAWGSLGDGDGRW